MLSVKGVWELPWDVHFTCAEVMDILRFTQDMTEGR